MKKHLLYWRLTWESSRKNYAKMFRLKISAVVSDPSLQLSLQFDKWYEKVASRMVRDVSVLAGVHALRFHNCANLIDVSPLEDVSSCSFSRCNGLKDVACLANAHTLQFVWCNGVTDVSRLGGVLRCVCTAVRV
jgi:hypothetical protein